MGPAGGHPGHGREPAAKPSKREEEVRGESSPDSGPQGSGRKEGWRDGKAGEGGEGGEEQRPREHARTHARSVQQRQAELELKSH